MNSELLTTGLAQGLILSCVAYAIMIPFRLLNLQDITAEGAYPLGGAICAKVLLLGCGPGVAMLCAMAGGGVMGMFTSLVHLKLNMQTLLAGIILSTMAYSVNLRIMGCPNLALFTVPSFFTGQTVAVMIVRLLLIVLCIVVPLALYLKTEHGLRFRAVGLNLDFARRQSIRPSLYVMLGMGVAGSLSGLAGSLMVQMQNYMDIGIGVGIVIHGLAALMLGEALVRGEGLVPKLSAPLVGALVYQQIQGLAFAAGLASSDSKFFTGLLVLGVIALQRRRR
ncbi:MAG: putative tryptophan/tyrosine transport system permease protein [Candidatus Dependentiae bacterium]|nr:putative tryptophan/tyrosine transport system permease protein [Candidatus Dependentiae bacterium]